MVPFITSQGIALICDAILRNDKEYLQEMMYGEDEDGSMQQEEDEDESHDGGDSEGQE